MLNKKRFNRHSLFVPAALIVVGTLGVSSANAADPQCYNLASLQGQYALITKLWR